MSGSRKRVEHLTTNIAAIATTAPADRVRSAIRTAGYENQPIND